jgi:hypothetical protein
MELHMKYRMPITLTGTACVIAVMLAGCVYEPAPAPIAYRPPPPHVIVQRPPPPPIIVEAPPPPPPEHPYWVWERGHWTWNGYNWVWVHGHYVERLS